MAKSELNWLTIDIATLTTDQRKAWDAYKAQYAAMKAAREEFEHLIAKAANPPAGKRVVFGYNFGKLSVALADDDAKRSAKPSSSTSLADLVRR